ncbi:MAG: VOC family protein [Micromonosporaceae bacterium]|nr:VOC family protein [Micromonosporaceae bacterium]
MEICFDTNDPDRLRSFWELALGYQAQPRPDGSIDLVDPDGNGPDIWFQSVPEQKTSKNRIHFDVYVPRATRADLTRQLVDLGGGILAEFETFTVLADPEGNEFCLNDG